MRGLVPKFIMLICLLHINFRPFDPCERVLTKIEIHRIIKIYEWPVGYDEIEIFYK